MYVNFKQTDKGFEIVDTIERQRYRIVTETPVTPELVDDNRTLDSMDSAVAIATSGLSLPDDQTVYIRNPDWSLYEEIHPAGEITLPYDEYILDLSGPVKVYAHIDNEVRISFDTVRSRTNISFGETTPIVISARSFHRRPAETVKSTDEPIDVMQAVSTFGSALKTITSERSYPTLRGHPPAIKLADKLSIPDSVERPQTGIQIEVPPTLRHVFAVSPLAYYLAAEVIPGSEPQLVTQTGWTYSLAGDDGFETAVERVLKQVFLLDCVVQTEGESPAPLYERQVIEPKIGFDIKSVYDKTIDKQLETYLEVPYSTIETQLPEWHSETRLGSTADYIEYLPFIANDLTSVKVDTRDDFREPHQISNQVKEESVQGEVDLDSGLSQSPESTGKEKRILPVPAIQQWWISSNGVEVANTKPLSTFRNSITQSPWDGPFTIEVICNDPDMSDELVSVNSIYGDQNGLPFNFTIHHDLSTKELREVFRKESDFIHYIGHIDKTGFRCSDGAVDATTLKSVRTRAFFLNACQSYEQGLGLLEAGSVSGIVTQTDIQNSTAAEVGSTIAQLLNIGLPLHASLNIVQRSIDQEHKYHIIGDGEFVVTRTSANPPTLCELDQSNNSTSLKLTVYTSPKYGCGSIYIPYIASTHTYHTVPGQIELPTIAKSELIKFFNKEELPVLFNGELRWSTKIKTSEL